MTTTRKVDILQIGLGRLGGLLEHAMKAQGWAVHPARRTPAAGDLTTLALDAAQPWAPVLAHLQPTDVVLCLAPSGRTVADYRQAYVQPAQAGLAWCQQWAPAAHLWLISSTSVYPQNTGEWVDETSSADPQRATAQQILAAERIWLNSPQPATVLRLAGLYGPGREYLLRQAAQPLGIANREPIYTNRVHVDDVASALVHLIHCRAAGKPVAPIYNVVDCAPVALQTLLPAIRKALAWPEPKQQVVLERASKRVSSAALAATGFQWRYPTWEAGYADVLQAKRAAGVRPDMLLDSLPQHD